jgi:D-alanyl-D-alanine carboxypeptidase
MVNVLKRLAAALVAWVIVFGAIGLGAGGVAQAAPYAALVMDEATGKVLHSRNADTKLHPASLTKMMTLYLVFEALESGRLKANQSVRISRRAAGQPPSKLGLRTGQRVPLRDLIRAAAVKSANDAAVALAEAVAGSESAFAKRMTKRARQFGMRRTTFRNASGLTQSGHLSTARDMAILGQRLFRDFPDYYHLFKRRTVVVQGRTLRLTNKLVGRYEGADGIKTGYTRAAGFNLVASAERKNVRIIAALFGGRSSATRNARMRELLDMGFARAPKPTKRKRLQGLPIARAPLPVARPGAQASVLARGAAALGEVLAPAAHADNLVADAYAAAPLDSPMPERKPRSIVVAAAEPAVRGGGDGGTWAVQVGAFNSREEALAQMSLAMLSGVVEVREAESSVQTTKAAGASLFRARFTGLDRRSARRACSGLKHSGIACVPISPGGW